MRRPPPRSGEELMDERSFLTALRALPLHPGAAGLRDATASIAGLTITTDTLVDGVHFLPADPPEDVAWKLLATNLSDLAAKGAAPEGVLLNYPLSDAAWDRAFLAGLDTALRHFACPLLGGDAVRLPAGAPRLLALAALGRGAPRRPRGTISSCCSPPRPTAPPAVPRPGSAALAPAMA